MNLKIAILAALSFAVGLELSANFRPWEGFRGYAEHRTEYDKAFRALAGSAAALESLRVTAAESDDRESERVWLSLLVQANDKCAARALLVHTEKYRPELLDLDRKFYAKHLADNSCRNDLPQ